MFFPCVVDRCDASIIGPLNPGFEDGAGQHPLGWQLPTLVWPLYSIAEGEARSGTAAVKCSPNDYYTQVMPASPARAYAFSFWSRGDDGNERANLRIEWLDALGNVVRSDNRFEAASNVYRYSGRSILSPPETTNLRIAARPFPGWVWYDDITVMDDSLANPDLLDTDNDDLPDRWLSAGLVEVDDQGGLNGASPAVALGPQGTITQPVAVLPFTVALVSVLARSDTPGAAAELAFHWRNDRGALIASATREIICTNQYAAYDLGTTPPEDAVFAEIVFTSAGAATVWADAFTYGWAAVKPSPFSPNGDGVRDEAVVTAHFSGVDSVGVSIVDGNTTLHIGPVQQPLETMRWAWDGRDMSGGAVAEKDYTIRLVYHTAAGMELAADLPVAVSSPVFLNPGGTVPEDLVRFVWGSGSMSVYRDTKNLEELKSHGITDIVMIVFWTPEEAREILDLAESAGLKIILQPWDVAHLVLQAHSDFETATEGEIYAELLHRYGDILDHPALRGFMSFDEPSPEDGEQAFMLHRMLRSLAPGKFIYTNLFHSPPLLSNIIRPDVVSGDFYPVRHDLGPGVFIGYEFFMDGLKGIALDQGVDFWMITQGFGDIAGSRMPWPSEGRMLVNLALARSAKGIGYFYFINPFSRASTGLIDFEGNETRIYRGIGFNNQRLEAVSSVIMNVRNTSAFTAASTPGRVVPMLDEQNNPVVLVINDDCRRSRTLTVTCQGLAPSRIRDTLTGVLLPFDTTGSGVSFDILLAPGDARHVRIEP